MPSALKRRTFLGGLGAAATASILAACSTGKATSGKSQSPTVRFSVGVDPGFAPIYVANHDGLFKKAGLSIELVQVEGGAAGVQNVSAGTTAMSVNADATTLPVAAANSNIKAIASFESSDTYFKVVLAKGVTPKTIQSMAYFPGLGQYMTERYLKSIGVNTENVKMIKASPPDFPAILARGDADGFIIFEPWVSRGVAQGGHIVANSKDFDTGFSQWIIADERWLSKNEDVAARIVKVLADAADKIQSDPQVGVLATVAESKVPEATAASAMKDIKFKVRGFDSADYAASKELVEFFTNLDVIKSPVDLTKVMLQDWYQKHVLSK